jgi:acetate---CoA ligase (ADP-forming) subunit beta
MRLLPQDEVVNIIKRYGISMPQTVLLKSEKEAGSIPALEYPVILKIDSPDIVHKSDSGMVVVGIKSKDILLQKIKEMATRLKKDFPKAKVSNYVIQEFIKGKETIIGMKRDSTFGPVIMFGLGGIFVEVLKDVSFRIAPLKKDEALEMIKEIKSYKILEGLRGEKPVNVDALVSVIMAISDISSKHGKIDEIDLNPVIVNEKGAYVVDIRFLEGD